MSLKMNHEHENNIINNENVVPLDNEQMKSILKTQSEAVFQDKNISNNSNFTKKSLIEIALDFESKQERENNLPNDHESVTPNEIDTNELKNETIDQSDKNEDEPTLASMDKKDLSIEDNVEAEISLDTHNNSKDNENIQEIKENQNIEEPVKQELDEENSKKLDYKSEDTKNVENLNQILDNNKEETQQALNSVRDAVSQSINQPDNKTNQTTEKLNSNHEESTETIIKDMEGFKNIFSSLSSLSEKAIYDVMENKIIDLAKELAGYQIDKMPEKYEKKIKTFLKNINCFEEKITIEVNEKDLEALSKIEEFKNISKKSQFLPNKDIARGDIILNCDGMYYSEKTLKKN
jgi:hypothetical protein